MEKARVATQDDLPTLTELASNVITELVDTRGGAIWSITQARVNPIEPAIKEAIDDPNQLVLVGLLDAAILGYAIVVVETTSNGEKLAVITDIYVEADARSVGIGEAMMDQIMDWAQEQGCIGVDSMALPGNRATKNFFETFGLVARAIIVHKSLR
ncbi:MAG: GNAT family N-acetyltransferase [Acidimicrobiia bacterium]